MKRAAVVVVSLLLLSGCSSGFLSGPAQRSDSGGRENPAHAIWIRNGDNISHSISTTVTNGNNAVLNDSRTISIGGEYKFGTITKPGTYHVNIKTEGRERSTIIDLPIDGRPNSTTEIYIRKNGNLSITTVGQDYGS